MKNVKGFWGLLYKVNWKKITWWILFISLLMSISLIIVNMVLAPSIDGGDAYQRERSDYVLPLIQCALGLIVMFLPQVIEHKWSIGIPSYMQIIYFIFLYCAVYLGEVRNFYFVIPHWDTILHAMSGAMLGAFGFLLVNILNESPNVQMKLSPLFVSLFAFCFAIAAGIVWEMYEFGCDSLLGTNMQKYKLEDGTVLIGQAALSDTMEDIITDSVSALTISAIGFVSLKKKQRENRENAYAVKE